MSFVHCDPLMTRSLPNQSNYYPLKLESSLENIGIENFHRLPNTIEPSLPDLHNNEVRALSQNKNVLPSFISERAWNKESLVARTSILPDISDAKTLSEISTGIIKYPKCDKSFTISPELQKTLSAKIQGALPTVSKGADELTTL
eukprot:IDg15075t1